MPSYTKYSHVRRIGTEGTEGYLEGHIVATPKVDGVNCTVWFDTEAGIERIGGREEPIRGPEDICWLGAWFENRFSGNVEAFELAKFVREHPNLIVYGEWLGGMVKDKFAGAIKDYDKEHLRTIKIFDVRDAETGEYLDDHEWRAMLGEGYPELAKNAVPILGEFDDPTEEELWQLTDENLYMREKAGTPGEGIVIRNRDFKDAFGNYHIVKLVRSDWKKEANARQREKILSDIEQAIVDEYMSDAEMSKTLNKALAKFGDDKFDATSRKHMGFFTSVIFRDLVGENILDMIKRFKKPKIDFARLEKLALERGDEYLRENGYIA